VIAGEKVRDQVAARLEAGALLFCVPVICHRGEAAISMYREPGASGLQVAPAENLRIVRPPVCVLCRPRMKLVAISRDDQGQLFMLPKGNDQQTHAHSITRRLRLLAC